MPAGLGKIKNIDTGDMNILRNNSSSIKNGTCVRVLILLIENGSVQCLHYGTPSEALD